MQSRAALAGALLGLTLSAAAQPVTAEMTTREQKLTFQTGANLVLVPVVVRDARGRVAGGLRLEDFQLFDRGKLQTISRFSVEPAPGPSSPAAAPSSEPRPPQDAASLPPAAVPERFVAYLLDDLNLDIADMMRVKQAVLHHIDTALRPVDRAAIVTTSAVNVLDFTADREQLRQAVSRLASRPVLATERRQCPDLNYYWANLIRNNTSDPDPREFAMSEAYGCLGLDPRQPGNQQVVLSAVQQAVSATMALGDQNTRVSLTTLDQTVRRLSVMPGQRSIVLVSPGFLTPDVKQEESEIIDRAIRSNVMVSSLDGRGLYVEGRDLSKSAPVGLPGTSRPLAALLQFIEKTEHETALLREDVLAEVAYGTGGAFFHNRNDLEEGLRQLAAPPEAVYILGFSPQNLKLDGGFHSLKVVVKGPPGLSVTARRGYTAPKSLSDPGEVAREEIRQALFSRDELHDFPADLHHDFFKRGPDRAGLSVIVHIDLKPLAFKKENGRSREDLAVIVGLFDRNGNYAYGARKDVELRLKEETFERWMRNGITVPCSFEVKPGTYLLRLVVRDDAGQMAARNGVVEIP